MYRQPLTHREILELHTTPDKFIAEHPERVLIHMIPMLKKSPKEKTVYIPDKIVVLTR